MRMDREWNLLKIVYKLVLLLVVFTFQIQAPESWYLIAAPTRKNTTSRKAFYLGMSPEM
jgi:hypothetical protein